VYRAALLSLLGLSAIFAQDGEPARVTAIRCWTLNGATRIAIETTKEVTYRTERLDQPDRLLIDLKESRLKLADPANRSLDVNDPMVKRVRVAQNQPAVTRVVIELAVTAAHEISQLSNPPRLMVELRPLRKDARPVISEKPAPKVEAPAPAPVVAAAPVPAAPAEQLPLAPQSAVTPPKAARKLSTGNESLTRALGLKLGKVVIDAGHGGHDQGTAGPTGLLEKDLVLDVALRLGALLEQRMGSQVVYTRSTDVFVALEERTAMANAAKADLFLSIHANSSPLRNISGAETYYLNFTSSKVDLEVAARENASSTKSIHELRELIQKIALKEKLDESREFAARLQGTLAGTWMKANDSARNRGTKKAPFVVLIGASMPSVLAEVGFLSNPRDEGLMKKADYRQKLAEALCRGIEQYAESLGGVEVAQRSTR